jgi:hypothetical protein
MEKQMYMMFLNGKPEYNTIRFGRKHCIEDFTLTGVFKDWKVAKDFGYRVKKVRVTIEEL